MTISWEQGSVLAFTCIFAVALFGMAALVVDIGRAYHSKADMQNASDAAALAGADRLPDEEAALANALDLCEKNGYVQGQDGVNITCIRNPGGGHPSWYQVEITKPIDYFLAPILGYDDGLIRTHAAAQITSALPININGGGQYGINGIQNLSVFGPYAYYTYGDPRSPKWYDNGQTNPYYNKDGYNFTLDVPANYQAINGTNQMMVEIFDPETYNSGDAQDAGVGKCDEIRTAPGSPHQQPVSKYTTTKYSLYAPDNTPGDYSDDVLIATKTYGPNDKAATDQKWISPSGYTVNLSTWGVGTYRINVVTTDGSSENGFNLRAGPPRTTGVPFDPNNGTKIDAIGSLPINFNVSGVVNIELGEIPAEAGGCNVYINKFDTDVGAQSIQYYDDLGHTWSGQLASNGTWKLDTLTMPAGYPGSKLHAKYTAGSQDTSEWEMYFDGYMPGAPVDLKLVD